MAQSLPYPIPSAACCSDVTDSVRWRHVTETFASDRTDEFSTVGTLQADPRDDELARLRQRVTELEQEVTALKSQVAELRAALKDERANSATLDSPRSVRRSEYSSACRRRA